MSKRFFLIASLMLAVSVFCLTPALISLRAVARTGNAPGYWGFNVSNLDKSCKPCNDFYEFAMGGWMKANPIPPAYPRWGSFTVLADKNEQGLRQILEDVSKEKPAAGTNAQKVGDFYLSCMDTTAINQAGTKPIEAELARIAKVSTAEEMQAEAAHLQENGAGVWFRFGADQDSKDSTRILADASQGGLDLPDRDYYLKTDEKSKQVQGQYVAHISKMFQLLGDGAEQANTEATKVMAIETALAKVSMSNVDRRDPVKTYHKMKVAEVQALTPNFSWAAYLKQIGHPQIQEVNVEQPEFFKGLDAQLKAAPIADWKIYFRWHLLHAAAGALPEPFVMEDFAFNGRTMTGTKEIRPLSKRCVQSTDKVLGEALGEIYVKRYFPADAKAHALEMVHNLIGALHDDLQTLPWMSPQTRTQAEEKLQAFMVKIGFPDKWRDYSALKIDRASFLQNEMRGAEFNFQRILNKIGRPVDRTEWTMTPPTVNAYNNGNMNEIVFPAGILQPPFYDPKADDAVNYGGMGAVIGHEITHGFDDEGSQFDAKGNLKNWWTQDDLKNFQTRAQCVANQFDGFVVEDNLHENGKLVEGESIADLGGLTIAYAAYEKSLQGKARPTDKDGFTPEQRFFLGWAQVWGSNVSPEYARLQANTNPHPLPKFRVNGPLSNMAEFAKAFGCKRGEAMVRENVCKIW